MIKNVRITRVILLSLLLFLSFQALSFPKRKYNQRDENGKKTGWWITYWDEEKKKVSIKNYYINGREQKISKNYSIKGLKVAKFRYYKDRIRVKYYNENGKLWQKGWAKMNYTQKEIRFYWEGKWKFYNKFGAKVSESFYLDGEKISEKYKGEH